MGAYRGFLRMMGETAEKVNELADIKRTRCTINGFERRVKYHNFQIVDRRFYFINPHYETKFGLRPRKLWNWLARIPYIRDYFVTTCFYILEHNHAK
jgi:hypothetical protein